jgi:hypothetical protein
MSVPNNRLSSVPVVSGLLPPYDREVTDLTDWCRGGIALSDPSETLDFQNWSIGLDGNDVVVTPETAGTPSVIFSRPDITELSLGFDNNMRPVIAFVQAGQGILYFFDPVIDDYQFQDLPVGAITPRCVLDDTRPSQVQTSSVIVSYVYDGSLWLLDQLDRYTIPYNLTLVDAGAKLDRMGMSTNLRMHWLFQVPE